MTTPRLRSIFFIFALTLAGLLLPATKAIAQGPELLIDTGAGVNTTIFQPAMFSTGGACSPEPTCGSNFQFLAAKFTLNQATTLDSVQAWMAAGIGGSLTVRIRSVNPAKNGLPGQTTPPYLGPTSIYEKTYVLTGGSDFNWVTFSDFNAILSAGTYWLCFEPVSGSGFNRSMPGGAPNPLEQYAFFSNGNPGYLQLNLNPTYLANTGNYSNHLGIRIYGTNFPGHAFGTVTRTMMTDPFFDITRGDEGEALTYSWIIDLNGNGFTFAVGRLNQNGTQDDLNGLSAGAAAATCWSLYFSPCATSGGRGIAYRTFINKGTDPKTFRINAVLDGIFGGTGAAKAAAGVYAFDSTEFTNTLNNSTVGVAEFLTQRDGLAQFNAADSSLSLATLFPVSARLTSVFVTPTFPTGTFSSVPLTTGFITIPPGGTFTLMFDVMAYSSNGGGANFSDTLAPAANFFTDSGGNPVTDIIAVGPSQPSTAVPASIMLSPGSSTNPVGTTHTVTATVTTSTGAPVPNETVFFTLTSGPNVGLPVPFVTDANGQASFSYTSPVAGTDSVRANIGALLSNTVQKTWTAVGKADTNSTVTSNHNPSVFGQSVTFTATVTAVAPGTGTPTGTVDFMDDATTLASGVALSGGMATFSTSSLSIGTHSITAVYSGDSNFNATGTGASTATALTQQVQYGVCLLHDPTKAVTGGGTFPLKLYLCSASGGNLSSSAIPIHATSIFKVSGYSGAPEDAGNANPDNDFRFDPTLGSSGGYIFNLKTTGLGAGTYGFMFTASGDPTTHTVLPGFGVK